MKKILNYLVLFGVAGVVIALDQWTKALVRANIAPSELWLPAGFEWLMPYARIINWHNSGAAFGSFQGFSWVFTVLAFVVSGLIIYYYPQVAEADWWMKLAMGMQLGGALGNVIDRLTQQGNVTDFISVGTFPVFNVADSSISVGVAILLLGVWLKERAERVAGLAGSGDPRQTSGDPRQTSEDSRQTSEDSRQTPDDPYQASAEEQGEGAGG